MYGPARGEAFVARRRRSVVMDEKTSSLRELFLETTGTESVTERQDEDRGTLLDRADGAVRAVVRAMRERSAFTSGLDDETLAAVARGVHEGYDDETLADALGVGTARVLDARLDLHLVREADRDPPAGVERETLHRLVEEGATLAAAADETGVDPGALALSYRVALVDAASRRVNGRFRDEFAAAADDADLAERLTEMDDGLREATEDIETNVKL